MNRTTFYIATILAYLTLAYFHSTHFLGEKKEEVKYLRNLSEISKISKKRPLTIIFTDYESIGFLIKSHYIKLKVLSGQSYPKFYIFRTSKKNIQQLLPNLGLSLFRRYHKTQIESFNPLPPGGVFINNFAYGRWKRDKGSSYWSFYRSYKHFSRELGWGEFKASKKFLKSLYQSEQKQTAYYGENNEFGLNGAITQENFPDYFSKREKKELSLKELIVLYLRENF